MSNLKSCERCGGFVPSGRESCPNCNSSRAWWRVPLAIAGAGFATVTLSACYGPACVTQIKLRDGTYRTSTSGSQCGELIDCTAKGEDGGLNSNDPRYAYDCEQVADAGSNADAGASDAGTDGGTDAGP